MEKDTLSPLVSFVIPVYNTPGTYLRECLESISMLDFSFEIIVVNDGSVAEDTLLELQYADKVGKLINITNSGVSAARNVGIKNTNGTYIFCLDADDKLNVVNFNKAVAHMVANTDIDILYSDYQNFGDISTVGMSRPFDPVFLFISGNFVSACSLFRRKIWVEIGGYDESFSVCEDYDFWVRAALKRYRFHYFHAPIFFYRRILDGKSLSQSQSAQYLAAKEKIKSRISINQISKEDLYNYILNSFRRNKTNLLKLALSLFAPALTSNLIKRGIFKSKYFID